MTDNEKIRDILNRHYGHEVMAGSDLWFTKQYQDRFAHLFEMAKWKENQMIKKAIEWLKENTSSYMSIYWEQGGYATQEYDIDKMINDFKKSMEE